MFEEVGALRSSEGFDEFCEPAVEVWHGALGSFAQQRFELTERLLDGIEIGRVLGEVAECRSDGFDGFGDTVDLVSGDIVHDDDVAGLKGGRETLFDVGEEGLSVHRPLDDEGSDHFVVAQACDEGDGFPMSVRRVVDQSIATWAASPGSHHVGGDGRLIEKHQPRRIQQVLLPYPTSARAGHIGAVLLAGVQRFF